MSWQQLGAWMVGDAAEPPTGDQMNYCSTCGTPMPCAKCDLRDSDSPRQAARHTPDQRVNAREHIERDVKRFLKAGGKVTKIKPGTTGMDFITYRERQHQISLEAIEVADSKPKKMRAGDGLRKVRDGYLKRKRDRDAEKLKEQAAVDMRQPPDHPWRAPTLGSTVAAADQVRFPLKNDCATVVD